MSLTSIDDALRRIRRGEMVLVVDDEDRENEGDLTLAAEWVTPEAVNFMMRWARGLVCMPCSVPRLDELEMGPMVARRDRRLRHRVHGDDRPPRRRERHRRRGSCAHDPQDPRPRVAPGPLRTPRPRVPVAGARGRRARAPRSHRSRGRPRPARRLRAGRRDLRGAARRRFAGTVPVPRAVRARSTASHWCRSRSSSNTASRPAPRRAPAAHCSCRTRTRETTKLLAPFGVTRRGLSPRPRRRGRRR